MTRFYFEATSDEARRRLYTTTLVFLLVVPTIALIVILEIITHSNVFGKFSVQSLTTLALVLLAGPVVYLIARGVRRSSSIDLDLAMRELPPE